VDVTPSGLARLSAARLAVFLDFDGCLVDLAARPQDVVVPCHLPPVLERLNAATGGALALVSGRPVHELRRFVPGLDALLCGSHGAERGRRGGAVTRLAVDRGALGRAAEEAEAAFSGTRGLIVERKPVGIGLHYRGAPGRRGEVERLAARLLDVLPGYHAHHGKMVIELRPDGIGKGHAVADLMRGPRFRGRVPVMFGDDATDEPAFAEANRLGGLSVKVGAGPTAARARLGSPAAVRRVLAHWAAEATR
jgi:trehalose 6-phosphate phosphatase